MIAYRAPGAYAEELVVPASALVPKPDTLDWAQASGLMVAGVTAWHLLAATGVGAGDTVLIHGAAGGVGVMAVQLALDRGAAVVGTASPANHDFLRELGAIPVEYGTGLMDRVAAAAPGGVDAGLDLAGTDEALDVSFVLVPDRTRIATIMSFERGLNTGIKVLGGAPGADPGTEIRDAARLDLARLAQDGKLRVFVSHTFPLAEVDRAHEVIMQGHTRGKIALIPYPPSPPSPIAGPPIAGPLSGPHCEPLAGPTPVSPGIPGRFRCSGPGWTPLPAPRHRVARCGGDRPGESPVLPRVPFAY